MEDKLLRIFFENKRWEQAIQKAVDKGINKGELRELCTVEKRLQLLNAIENGQYKICPPHMAEIPKDDGTMRIVYVNEGIDRVFLSIVNDMLFELVPEKIHTSCTSYQKGIGCGKVVQKVSKIIYDAKGKEIGWKSDLSKYFDSVPIEFIDKAFDDIELKLGKSKIIDIVRDYYHQDYCFDVDGNLIEKYQSLKQGCAVAAYLADVMLYHIDEMLSNLNGFYVRYSDDTLFIGADYKKAMSIMETELNKMSMKLNPKKVEYLSSKKWFKFLGYSIKGDMISLSKNRIKTFQKEVEARTIKKKNISKKQAINKINTYLYKGNGEYAWAEQVLRVINCEEDIKAMNEFVMDCIRAVERKRYKVGGLGYENKPNGVITRGIGKNVKANREKTAKEIEGYYTLNCMRNALMFSKPVYDSLVLAL